MTSRERVQCALNHREPDRIPIDLGGCSTTFQGDAYRKMLKYLELPDRQIKKFVRDNIYIDEDVLEKFHVDTRYINYAPIKEWTGKPGVEYDIWGCKWEKKENKKYFDPVNYPLIEYTSFEDIPSEYWDNLEIVQPGQEAVWEKEAKNLYGNNKYAIVANPPGFGIFESSWSFQGMEQFLLNLLDNPTFCNKLMDKVLEILLEQYELYLKVIGKYIDVICYSGDLGSQNGPLINPELYRSMIKPLQKIIFDRIHELTDAKIWYHSCGDCYLFIPDLIEVGVDILNPIQVACPNFFDTSVVKREFGKDIVFWGGSCDSQSTLPFGTPKEVEKETRRRIGDLSPGGGFVFASIHHLQGHFPEENIVTMFETAKEFHGN